MQQIKFAGSWFATMADAAKAWAATTLPDVSALEPGEDPYRVSVDLEAFWWGEAQKIGEGAPEGVDRNDVEIWRACCRRMLRERIETATRADRAAVRSMHR